ncbi:PqqD family protein [Streptomyces sp. NPDC054866]
MDAKPQRSFDVRTDVATGAVLLVKGLDAYELDDIGARVWTHCDGRNSVDQIVDIISTEYEVSREVVLADVNAFVKSLLKAGLLEG